MFLPYKGNKIYKKVISILYKRAKNGMLSYWKAMETYKPMYQAAHFPFHGKRNFWKTPIQTEVMNGESDQCGNNFIGIYKERGLLFIIRLQTVFIRKYNRKVSILHDGSLSGTDYTALPIKHDSYKIFSAGRA